jgi:hypothetical protein
VVAVGYGTFLSRLISLSSLILCKFLAGANRFVVRAVHKIAGPWLHTCPAPGILSMLLLSHERLGILDIQRYFKCTENEINSLFNSALIEI